MSGRDKFARIPERVVAEKLFWQPDPERPPVLDRLDCVLEKGHFYGIIGPNGSGKTTLLRHLLRLTKPDEGRVTVNDTDIALLRRRQIARLFSYVPQKIETGVSFSVAETVMMGRNPHLRLFGYPEKADREAVTEAMKSTGVEELADSPMSVLSGGETQRVLLARSIAQACPWLFLDEPVSNLDIFHQFSVMDMLRTLNRNEGKTIVCVLHDINLAAMYCDRIIVLEKGRVAADGNVREVLIPDLLERVYHVAFHRVENPGGDNSLFIPRPPKV